MLLTEEKGITKNDKNNIIAPSLFRYTANTAI
jgi:hypothetical protein